MKKITLYFSLLAITIGFSQSIPITFDSGIVSGAKVNGVVTPTDANWFSDSGLTSVSVEDLTADTPDNGNAGKIVSSATGQPWQNAQILLQDNYIDLTTNKVITLDVYSENPQDFLLKMEQSKNGGANSEKSFSHGGTGWETITVDFSTPNAGQPVPNDQYKLFVIFPCYSAGFATAPFDSVTYIDNFSGTVGDAIVVAAGPTTNAPTPTLDAADVISIYSDSYSDITGTNFNPVWGQSTAVNTAYDPTGEGNNTVIEYSNFNYQGTEFPSTDMSGMTHAHFDIWTANEATIQFTPISPGQETLVSATSTGGEWTSIDISLSNFPNVNFADVIQLKYVGSGTVYLDNIYFYAEQTSSGNAVTVETSQAWNGYINAFNVSDNSYAFGFSYGVADLRATATATSMTLEPNIAIWTAESANTAWFDNSSGTQTPVKYIEASSFVENNALAGSDLTFSGTVSSNDLNSNYTVSAFIKALDPNNGYATVVNETASLTGTTGAFSVSATAAQLTSGLIIQYGFVMTGLPADPTDTTLGSLVVGEVPAPAGPTTSAPTPPARDAGDVFSILSDAYTNETPAGGLSAFAGASIEDYVIGGTDNTLKVTAPSAGGGYQYVFGIPNGVDLSAFTHMHIDYYVMGNVVGGEVLQTFLQQFAGDGTFQHNIINTAAVTTSGSWVSLDVEIATMASGNLSRDNIGQIQMVLAGPVYGPVYLDNIYFYREATQGLEDNVFNTVKMFPNPAKDTVQFSVNSNENLDIEIFDMIGKSVLRVDNVRNEVNVSELNSGLYFVRMTIGTQQSIKKLVVN